MAKDKQPLVPQGAWATGLAAAPVFIDGLTSSLSYLVIATKDDAPQYSAVVVGKWGSDFKVKFYGSFEEWGFTKDSLEDKFKAINGTFLSRKGSAGYERYWTDIEGVRRILKALSATRGVTVAPSLEAVSKAYDMPYEDREAVSKLVHPQRGGTRPKLPFKHTPVLDTVPA